MASENETVMAVCAEWRECIESADPSVWNDERIAGLVKTTKAQQIAYLDRIEAAWKRESRAIATEHAVLPAVCITKQPGNAAAMREACAKMRQLLMLRGDGKTHCILSWDEFNESQKMLRAALAAPARNCDVGTAEEQSERFMDFCRPGNRPPNCEDCKVYPKRMNKFWCQLEWAQMPYEEQEGGEA